MVTMISRYWGSLLFTGFLTSKRHAKHISGTELFHQLHGLPHLDSIIKLVAQSISQGRSYSTNCTCCHT